MYALYTSIRTVYLQSYSRACFDEEKKIVYFLASGGSFRFYLEILVILQYYTMILQRPRIIVGVAGFVPGDFVPEVWRSTNEPPHF